MFTEIVNRNSLFVHLSVVTFVVICVQNFNQLQVEAHGTMIDPVSRNSLWRLDGSAPVNYDDIELFCGGIGVTAQNEGRCGVCGDPINMRPPRPHETGGYMVVNKTVKNYFPGSTMDVMIDLDTNHGGYFTFELCRRDSFDVVESESCFEKLKFVDGSYRMRLRNDHSDKGLKSLSLLMPEDLRECRACILRWNYRAGNNWGTCKDGTEGMGCGPQELYRNCADISIGYQIFQHNQIEDVSPYFSLNDMLTSKKTMRKAEKIANQQKEHRIKSTYNAPSSNNDTDTDHDLDSNLQNLVADKPFQ